MATDTSDIMQRDELLQKVFSRTRHADDVIDQEITAALMEEYRVRLDLLGNTACLAYCDLNLGYGLVTVQRSFLEVFFRDGLYEMATDIRLHPILADIALAFLKEYGKLYYDWQAHSSSRPRVRNRSEDPAQMAERRVFSRSMAQLCVLVSERADAEYVGRHRK